MSSVPRASDVGFVLGNYKEEPVRPWLYTLGAMVLGIVVLRGLASLLVDAYHAAKKFFEIKTEDAETQTDEGGYQLPSSIYINPQSDVFHCSGCHHIGARAITKRACNICRNTE